MYRKVYCTILYGFEITIPLEIISEINHHLLQFIKTLLFRDCQSQSSATLKSK